ncbi:SAFB-like transcription modulator [Diorhabda carinulata]|uniref:SAFB-like transcription modulator n=1 Tax=Diorhabda carinulata TaxID=1163345 RepID=UPI0025A20F61|nr:SAFB-like transcription modulator [Diorhabda carinulata]
MRKKLVVVDEDSQSDENDVSYRKFSIEIMPHEVFNQDSSKKQECSTQQEVDLFKLDTEDGEIRDNGDDLKLCIDGNVGNTEQTIKLDENKTEESKSEQTDIKKVIANKNFKSNGIWVSNITRSIKAADLKNLFNNLGKVVSAKILTNGKSLYGFVLMENSEVASKCASEFNNTVFHDIKLTVSKNRPDIIAKTPDSGKKKTDRSKRSKVEQSIENKKNEKVRNKADNRKDNMHKDRKAKKSSEKSPPASEINYEKKVIMLRSKIDSLYQLNCKLERKLDNMQRLYNAESKKYSKLKTEMKKIQDQNREERRRLNLDRENFEKMKKIEQSRLDLDRMTLNKELSDTKKLKDNLKYKLDEIRFERASKRTRSPSPRRRSPIGLRNVDTYKEKKFKRGDNYNRDRTPSPPNLSSEISKRSGNVSSASSRQTYYSDGTKAPAAVYPFRQANVYGQNHWVGAHPKDQRRNNVIQGNNFHNSRYNGPSAAHPSSSVVVPPRAGNIYYQHW